MPTSTHALKKKTMALYDAQLPQFLSTARVLPDGSRFVVVTPEDTGAAEAKLLLQKVTAMENLLVGIVYEAGGRVNYMFGHSDGVNADCREYCKKQTKFLTVAAAASPILRRAAAAVRRTGSKKHILY